MRGFSVVRAGEGKRQRAMAEDGPGVGKIRLGNGWQQATERAAFCAAGQQIIPQDVKIPQRKYLERRQAARPVAVRRR